MKQKKVMGILIILLVVPLLLTMNKSYAANSSYILGITNIREARRAEKEEQPMKFQNTGEMKARYGKLFPIQVQEALRLITVMHFTV